MKLELVKKYEPDNIEAHYGCVALSEETTVSLVMDKEDKYCLLLLSPNQMRILPLNYLEKFTKIPHYPVLFAKEGGFGIIKNENELLYYPTIDSIPIEISIENKEIFQQALKIPQFENVWPPKIKLGYPNPISNNDVLPVCFEHTYFHNNPRYFACLNLNMKEQKAKWENWTNLDAEKFPVHGSRYDNFPPRIDSIMIKDKDVFIYTSGIGASYCKGMYYYGIVRTTKKGEIVETLLDSGDLTIIDQKKRGVNGVFTSSQKYAILTPVFQNDEWKGKQKLFSIETKELIAIEFPRGFGKYPRVMQESGKYFWVYLWDTRHFAICREK